MKKFIPLFLMALVIVGCHHESVNKTVEPSTETSIPAEQAPAKVNEPEVAKYMDFSDDALALVKGEQKAVVFFHANWCSWCRAREKEILANIDTLPENTVILKADFDKEFDLRKTLSVETKDTFVFIDENGQATNKSGASIDTIVQFFNDGTVSDAEDKIDGKAGYWDYDASVVATFKGKKPYALFFHADWCPSCKFVDRDIKKSLDTLPSGASIFKVDYDKYKDLKEQYGVKSQHTVVFFDKDGNQTDSVRGFGVDDLVEYFSK